MGLGVLVLCLALAAATVVLEGLFLRGALEVGRDLGLVEQRLAGLTAFLAFAILALALDVWGASHLALLGRHLEVGLRLELFRKLPRLPDRYLTSRPTSDMAEIFG